MTHFKLVYNDHKLDLPLEQPAITLYASLASSPGSELGDEIGLNFNAGSPKFFFDPNGDPEDDEATWLNPFLDTQWLSLPRDYFSARDRDYRKLTDFVMDYAGEDTPNSLTDEDWWEAPGLIATYSDELFTKARITMQHAGNGLFDVRATGMGLFGSSFDIAYTAPLSVKLVAYRNEGSEAELLSWFDTFLRRDDFAFSTRRQDDALFLTGTAKA